MIIEVMSFLRLVDIISISAGLLVILGAGAALIFTTRTNSAKYWRDAFEAEKVRVEQITIERDEQRLLKHEAINDVAALRLTHDLTPILKAQSSLLERIVVIEGIIARPPEELLEVAAEVVDRVIEKRLVIFDSHVSKRDNELLKVGKETSKTLGQLLVLAEQLAGYLGPETDGVDK